MKQKIPASNAPRNPLVVAARFRLAGAHRRSQAGERQRGRRELLSQIRDALPASRHQESP